MRQELFRNQHTAHWHGEQRIPVRLRPWQVQRVKLPGKLLPCTQLQYAAYLDTKADPVKVMSAYPTAAGRPTLKKSKAEPFKL